MLTNEAKIPTPIIQEKSSLFVLIKFCTAKIIAAITTANIANPPKIPFVTNQSIISEAPEENLVPQKIVWLTTGSWYFE